MPLFPLMAHIGVLRSAAGLGGAQATSSRDTEAQPKRRAENFEKLF